MPPGPAEEAALERRIRVEADALAVEFAGIVSTATVQRFLDEALDSFRGRSVDANRRPLLAGRFARERLQALAEAEGLIGNGRPQVLFVCVHNAGRSQMAAALLADRSHGRIDVRSAGSEPAEEINPSVVEAMAEIGLDLSPQFPKPLTGEVVRAADFVITMGCGDACPVYPGKRYLDWELADPAGQPLEVVRRIRDEIDGRVRRLIAEIDGGAHG